MPGGATPGAPGSVLVTGASGFIGRHLVARLAGEGYRVTGLDRLGPSAEVPGAEHVFCDLLDAEALSRRVRDAAPSSVIHLAARTDLDGARLLDYAANVEGVRNLVAAMRAAGTVRRAICTSTQLVCRIGYQPANDQDYQPSTRYGESKVRTEQIWREGDGAGADWCLVRPTTIWGPHMNPHYLRFFRMIRQGRYVHVGGGTHRKSYGYVGNTVVQYQRLLEAPAASVRGRVFYLADYQPLILEDWAEQFRTALAAPPIRTIPPAVASAGAWVGDQLVRLGWRTFPFTSFRLNNVRTSYVVDLAATQAVCGDLPYSLREGVDATVAWLRATWADGNAAAPATATYSGGN